MLYLAGVTGYDFDYVGVTLVLILTGISFKAEDDLRGLIFNRGP